MWLADVLKGEVGGQTHSADMSTHAHTAVLYDAKEDGTIETSPKGMATQKPSSNDETSRRGWPPSCPRST